MAATLRDDDDIISGINVTPLVDIALVLLIVFLVTAKLVVFHVAFSVAAGQGSPLVPAPR